MCIPDYCLPNCAMVRTSTLYFIKFSYPVQRKLTSLPLQSGVKYLFPIAFFRMEGEISKYNKGWPTGPFIVPQVSYLF